MIKFSTVLFVPLLFAFSIGKAQENNKTINSKWLELKSVLEKRISIINDLVSLISKSDAIDKAQISATKKNSDYLYQVIDPVTDVDKEFMAYASKVDDRLSQTIAKSIALLENDPNLRGQKNVLNLLMQLEGTENRLAVTRNEYNDLCKNLGNLNLIFRTQQESPSPKVLF